MHQEYIHLSAVSYTSAVKAEEAIVMGECGSDVGGEADSSGKNDIPPRKKVGVF